MPKRKTSNTKQTTKPRKTTNKGDIKPRSFYTDSLTKGEKERLPDARKVEGLDEEIALLRVKLNQLVAKHSDDTDGLVKTVRLLLQAVAIKYRLSPKAKDDLYESLAGVINGVGGIMLPEAFKMDKEK